MSDLKSPVDEILQDMKDIESTTLIDKTVKKSVDLYLSSVKEFESDRIELADNRVKTHKKISIFLGGLSLISVSALLVAMPFKEVQPYVITVDKMTGETSVARSISDAETITYGKALDDHWVRTFIIERNGYEWETVQNSFNTVKLMSSDKVFSEYNKYIQAENSPVNIFGEKGKIKIKVSTPVEYPSVDKTEKLVRVNFTLIVQDEAGNNRSGYKPTVWEAIITYNYKKELEAERDRVINPLNFQVTSYRQTRVTTSE
jgi:type IV secretion system protein VirB8